VFEFDDFALLVSFKDMDYGDYADNYFELADELESLLSRKVDLITDKSLKILILSNLSKNKRR
jgi:uncharacterized protein